jgi:hypothetical protein
MIPFQIDPTWYQRSWLGASRPRHLQSRRAILPRWWLAAALFVAVAAVEAAIVLEAGPLTVGPGDFGAFP